MSEINIVRGIDAACDKEVVRVIGSMPKWTPPRSNARSYSLMCTLPVRFRLPEDTIVEKKKANDSLKEKPFVTVEQMPSFPGGESEMMKFIAENLRYPTIPVEEGICARSTVRFVVEADGSISDIKAIRSCSESVDKEIIRVIELMPKWIPGKQGGRPVRVYFTLPVHWHPR